MGIAILYACFLIPSWLYILYKYHEKMLMSKEGDGIEETSKISDYQKLSWAYYFFIFGLAGLIFCWFGFLFSLFLAIVLAWVIGSLISLIFSSCRKTNER